MKQESPMTKAMKYIKTTEEKKISQVIHDLELHVTYKIMGDGNHYLNNQCTCEHWNPE